MSIKIKEVEVKVCDFCDKDENAREECLSCGKHICYNCKKTAGRVFHHAVYFSGSGDGFFCNQCIAEKPKNPKVEKLLNAYLRIAALRTETELQCTALKERIDKAEAALKELQPED